MLLCTALNNVLSGVVTIRMYPQYRPQGQLDRETQASIMGRIRDIFTRVAEPDGTSISPTDYGFSYVDVTSFDDASLGVTTHGLTYGWSMKAYKSAVAERREEEADKWDELEKSITARLADEIRIFIRGNAVELVIEKAF